MASSPTEGLRRLSGLVAVLAAVAAQSFVTGNVDANQNTTTQTYGVQLLEHELVEPTPPVRYPRSELAPSVAEPDSSATTLYQVNLVPKTIQKPAGLLPLKWRNTLSERRTTAADRDWPETRDAAGTLIRVSENDVLIPF